MLLGADSLASSGRGRAVSKYWVRSFTKLQPVGMSLHSYRSYFNSASDCLFLSHKTNREVVWNLGC